MVASLMIGFSFEILTECASKESQRRNKPWLTEISQGVSGMLELKQISEMLSERSDVLVISGAGMSTGSGISDYRDKSGAWKRPQPVQHQAFVQHLHWRQRYWARSQLGFPAFEQAKPNDGHKSLAALEQRGLVFGLITQNVDRLHQSAACVHLIF